MNTFFFELFPPLSLFFELISYSMLLDVNRSRCCCFYRNGYRFTRYLSKLSRFILIFHFFCLLKFNQPLFFGGGVDIHLGDMNVSTIQIDALQRVVQRAKDYPVQTKIGKDALLKGDLHLRLRKVNNKSGLLKYRRDCETKQFLPFDIKITSFFLFVSFACLRLLSMLWVVVLQQMTLRGKQFKT